MSKGFICLLMVIVISVFDTLEIRRKKCSLYISINGTWNLYHMGWSLLTHLTSSGQYHFLIPGGPLYQTCIERCIKLTQFHHDLSTVSLQRDSLNKKYTWISEPWLGVQREHVPLLLNRLVKCLFFPPTKFPYFYEQYRLFFQKTPIIGKG